MATESQIAFPVIQPPGPSYVPGMLLSEPMYSSNEQDANLFPTKAKIATDIVTGLDFLHKNGMIHGDPKPDSFLITDHFDAKLSDFGSARFLVPGLKLTTIPQALAFLSTRLMFREKSIPIQPSLGDDLFSLSLLLLQLFVFGQQESNICCCFFSFSHGKQKQTFVKKMFIHIIFYSY